MATGSCRACGYTPVAFGALACPRCAAQNPNPRVWERFAGRGMLIGLAGGAVVGGVLGWMSDLPGMAFGGALVGALPGLVVGLVVSLLAAAVAALVGRPAPRRRPTGAPDLPENVYVQFPVAGLGTEADLGHRLRVEWVLDAELRSAGGGRCGGGDMGSGKATVFLAVGEPARTVPRLLDALEREDLLADHLVVAEDTGRGFRVWWPAGYRGSFSLL